MNRIIELGNVYPFATENNSRSGRCYSVKGVSPTLTTPTGGGVIPLIKEQDEQNHLCRADNELQVRFNSYATWDMPDTAFMRNGGGTSVVEFDEKTRIRRLTPKECFRLQGWTDDYFEKAQFVNSDNQLYRQAGNGVTVTVIQAIAERMGYEQEGESQE